VKHPQTEKPLTKKELARLFRVFAHLLETAEEPAEEEEARPGGVRLRKAPLGPPSELARARARKALKKLGVLP
jgi:hypothetical protein